MNKFWKLLKTESSYIKYDKTHIFSNKGHKSEILI